MKKIAQILLGGLVNKLAGELTNRLVNPPIKKRKPGKSSSQTPQSEKSLHLKSSSQTSQSEKSLHLDEQLDELVKLFITDKATKKEETRKTDPPTLSQNNEYWTELSNWYRKQRGWTCENCNLNLKKDKRFLDTHHIFGRGYNSPEHLKALCVGCHAEQKTPSDHSFMKNDKRYRKFVRTYRKKEY